MASIPAAHIAARPGLVRRCVTSSLTYIVPSQPAITNADMRKPPARLISNWCPNAAPEWAICLGPGCLIKATAGWAGHHRSLAARFVIMRLSDVAERFGESAISAEGGLAPHPAAFRCVATGGPDRLPG